MHFFLTAWVLVMALPEASSENIYDSTVKSAAQYYALQLKCRTKRFGEPIRSFLDGAGHTRRQLKNKLCACMVDASLKRGSSPKQSMASCQKHSIQVQNETRVSRALYEDLYDWSAERIWSAVSLCHRFPNHSERHPPQLSKVELLERILYCSCVVDGLRAEISTTPSISEAELLKSPQTYKPIKLTEGARRKYGKTCGDSLANRPGAFLKDKRTPNHGVSSRLLAAQY
jgi:hypothetical protein